MPSPSPGAASRPRRHAARMRHRVLEAAQAEMKATGSRQTPPVEAVAARVPGFDEGKVKAHMIALINAGSLPPREGLANMASPTPPATVSETVKGGLTRRQQECLTVARRLIEDGRGVAPRAADVAKEMKITPSSAQRLMRMLCARGWAKWERFGHRNFHLLP